MNREGITYPNVLDLVTMSDDSCSLILVEERASREGDALALQEKLNNYLSYALDGGLAADYPESRGKRVNIRVDLYAAPHPFIVEFLARYRKTIASSGVGVICFCEGNELAL